MRILIRLPNWLGDVLLARPMLHALRAARPEAEIVGVAPATLLDLLAPDRVLDAAFAWPTEGAARATLIGRMRSWRPDAALVLPPSFSSALFAWRGGARRRIGYRHELRDALLTEALRRPARGAAHLSREYLALAIRLDPACAAHAAPLPALGLPAGARASAATLLARVGVGGAPYALLGPGATYGPAKRWAAERFAAVGRHAAAAGARVLVCGTGAERDACAAVALAIGPAAVCLAGETSLGALTALCAGARFAVCNDSGLAHLAAATGIPTVAIFGSTSSAWTAPLGARVHVVQHPPVCSPCFRRTCRIGYVCLDRVAVDDVLRAAGS